MCPIHSTNVGNHVCYGDLIHCCSEEVSKWFPESFSWIFEPGFSVFSCHPLAFDDQIQEFILVRLLLMCPKFSNFQILTVLAISQVLFEAYIDKFTFQSVRSLISNPFMSASQRSVLIIILKRYNISLAGFLTSYWCYCYAYMHKYH